MNDQTLELVPINLIESIVYDSNIFLKFIRTPNDKIFLSIDTKTLALSVIQYMDYAIKNSDTLNKNIFDRINYLSEYFKLDRYYDFEKYMEATKNIVSLQEIEQILNDEIVFNKFMNFEINRNFFKENISGYLCIMNEMFEYYEKSNIEISNIQRSRYNKIMEKYSLELKKYHKLEGYKASENINEDLLNKIFKNVDLNTDKFTLSYSLYIELCKNVIYDVNFNALNQKLDNKIAYDIYNKKINEINVENNKVVCKTWAEIYQKLLENVGIRATVMGGFHKYVLFDCDGTLIKADATNDYYEKESSIKMNDITRVKLEFDTVGFTCVEKNKNIDLPLKQAKEKINLKTQSSLNEMMMLEQNYCHVKSNSFELNKKLMTLFSIANNSNLDGIELLEYMLTLTKVFFKNNNNLVKAKAVYKNVENGYIANMLYIINEGDYKRYILYEKNKPFIEYSQEQIITMLNNGLLKMNGKYLKEEENGYTNPSRTK